MDARDLLKFAKRADRLDSLPRTGWLFGGVVQPESVAAHVYQTTLIALAIADEVGADAEQVMRVALLHDIGEALITDLPRPTKDFVGRSEMKAAEQKAAAHVLHGLPEQWLDCVQAYDASDSLESRIVKAADRIQMMIKACIYEAQGRGDVARFFDIPDESYGIPFAAELLAELRAMRDAGEWTMADLD